jgi:hypothetical protein
MNRRDLQGATDAKADGVWHRSHRLTRATTQAVATRVLPLDVGAAKD